MKIFKALLAFFALIVFGVTCLAAMLSPALPQIFVITGSVAAIYYFTGDL